MLSVFVQSPLLQALFVLLKLTDKISSVLPLPSFPLSSSLSCLSQKRLKAPSQFSAWMRFPPCQPCSLPSTPGAGLGTQDRLMGHKRSFSAQVTPQATST